MTAAVSAGVHGPFSTRAAVAMVAVGVGAALAFVGLTAAAPDLRQPDAGAHALSKSAVGYAGLVRLLKETGAPVVVSRGEVRSASDDTSLLVLTPPMGAGPKQRVRMEELTRNHLGPTLIILPKWMVTEDPRRPGWVGAHAQAAPGDMAPLLPADLRMTLGTAKASAAPVLRAGQAPAFPDGVSLPFGPVENLQAGRSTVGIPALVEPVQGVVLAEAKGRSVYVLTDPDLVNNHGLASWRTAQSALAMVAALRGPRSPVVFDVSLNGYNRSRSLLRVMLQPPFLPASLCGLLAAALMGAHAAVRFGAPRRAGRAIELGKRALADNAAALIRLANRRPSMAPRYAAVIRTEAGRALGAPRDLAPEALDGVLDRLGAARGTVAFSELAAEAQAVRTDADLMQSADKLHRWLREMTRDPG